MKCGGRGKGNRYTAIDERGVEPLAKCGIAARRIEGFRRREKQWRGRASIVVQRNRPQRNRLHGARKQQVLGAQHSCGKCVFVVAVQDRYRPMGDDRAMVEHLIDEMHRGSAH